MVEVTDTLKDAVYIALDQIGEPADATDVVMNLVFSSLKTDRQRVESALEILVREQRVVKQDGLYINPDPLIPPEVRRAARASCRG